MKNHTYFKSNTFALTIGLIFCFNIAWSQQYTLKDDDVVVENGIIISCSYNFESKNIIIPQILDGQTVTGTFDGRLSSFGLFLDKGITSVELPATLESIGGFTFYDNVISSLDLSGCTALVTIGGGAFSRNKIASLDFSDCTKLTSIGGTAFYSNKLTNVNLTSCKSLLSIGYLAFSGNYSLTGFALPEVTYDGKVYNTWKDGNNNSYVAGTDMATNLGTNYIALIPYTLTDYDVIVENGIITSCSYDIEFENIIIPQILDGQTVTGTYDGWHSVVGLFRDKGITSIELPASLESIGGYTFYDNLITSLDLSGCTALVTIGGGAFSNNKIVSLDLSDCTMLTSIGGSAFYDNKLTNVNLTGCASLLSIGDRAFYGNNSLTGFALPEVSNGGTVYKTWTDGNNNSYNAGTDMATDLNTFYMPLIPYTLTDDDVVVENGIIISCSYDFERKNIIIPQILDGQTVTGTYDGWGSSGLFCDKGITSVELPATLESIGGYTFYDNELSSLDLSGCTALVTIRERAFTYNKIDKVDLNNCANLLSIGEKAFYGNPSLKDFSLPDPIIPGYFYSYWVDDEGVSYNAVNMVSNLSTSYTRIMPEIYEINPVYATTSGSKEITLIGKQFEDEKNNKKIFFNGVESLSYKFWSDSLITVICPPNSDGAAKIEVSLENNITYTSPKQFYYFDGDVVEVCGNISGIWETGKTYLLKCTVTIPENETLVIEEGVKILAFNDESDRVSIDVYGNIEALGTSDDSIKFLSIPSGKRFWQGIKLVNNGIFKYCSIKNAVDGISQYKGQSVISNSTFNLNQQGINLHAGDRYISSDISNIICKNNFIGLKAEARGNQSTGNATVKISSSEFINNSNYGIYMEGSGYTSGQTVPQYKGANVDFTLENSVVSGNGSYAIYMYSHGYMDNDYSPSVVRYGNVAFYSYNNLIFSNGNGIYAGRSNVDYCKMEARFFNTVFWNNSQLLVMDANNIFFCNSNLWDNNLTGEPIGNCDSLVFQNCNINEMTIPYFGNDNITANPLFSSAENGNFQLTESSPCIDVGSNGYVKRNTDFAGKIRIIDGLGSGNAIVDIGAYEFNSYFVGVNDRAVNNLIKVYPNPTKSAVEIEGLPLNDKVKITVFNLSGKIVSQFQNTGSHAIINMTNESSGVYLIKIDGKTQKTFKIIKE